MEITEPEGDIHGEVVTIWPGEVRVEIEKVRVKGTVFVVVEDEVGDGGFRVEGISVEVQDLGAVYHLLEEANFLFNGRELTKGFSELDVVFLPSARMHQARPAGDVVVIALSGDLFEGDICGHLLEDQHDVVADRWYCNCHVLSVCMNVCRVGESRMGEGRVGEDMCSSTKGEGRVVILWPLVVCLSN